jgi:hypothetical protein
LELNKFLREILLAPLVYHIFLKFQILNVNSKESNFEQLQSSKGKYKEKGYTCCPAGAGRLLLLPAGAAACSATVSPLAGVAAASASPLADGPAPLLAAASLRCAAARAWPLRLRRPLGWALAAALTLAGAAAARPVARVECDSSLLCSRDRQNEKRRKKVGLFDGL